MIATVNGKPYEFKTAYIEFTLAEFLRIVSAYDKPVMERLQTYTGIPIEYLDKLPLHTIHALIEAVTGLENEGVLNAMAKKYEGVHVGLESYGKMCKVNMAMKGKGIIESLPKIVEIYTGRDVSKEPLLGVWGMAFFYLQSVGAFFNKYKRLGDYKYSDEELEAGVEVFEGFAHFPTVVKIGRERGLSNDAVLDLSAEEVYMEMLLDFERSEYERNLTKIHREREEHFSKIPK